MKQAGKRSGGYLPTYTLGEKGRRESYWRSRHRDLDAKEYLERLNTPNVDFYDDPSDSADFSGASPRQETWKRETSRARPTPRFKSKIPPIDYTPEMSFNERFDYRQAHHQKYYKMKAKEVEEVLAARDAFYDRRYVANFEAAVYTDTDGLKWQSFTLDAVVGDVIEIELLLTRPYLIRSMITTGIVGDSATIEPTLTPQQKNIITLTLQIVDGKLSPFDKSVGNLRDWWFDIAWTDMLMMMFETKTKLLGTGEIDPRDVPKKDLNFLFYISSRYNRGTMFPDVYSDLIRYYYIWVTSILTVRGLNQFDFTSLELYTWWMEKSNPNGVDVVDDVLLKSSRVYANWVHTKDMKDFSEKADYIDSINPAEPPEEIVHC
jgi:hypothetical protein